MAPPTSWGFLTYFSPQVGEMLLNTSVDVPSSVLGFCLLLAPFSVPWPMTCSQSSEQTSPQASTLAAHLGQVEGCPVWAVNKRASLLPSLVSPFLTPRDDRMVPEPCLPRDLNQESQILQLLCQSNHLASFGSHVSTTRSFSVVERNSLYIH